jgi:hypothetical protein
VLHDYACRIAIATVLMLMVVVVVACSAALAAQQQHFGRWILFQHHLWLYLL